MRWVPACLLAAVAFAPRARGDGEGGAPLMLFKEPDSETRRRITDELISHNGIGAATSDMRTLKRAELRRIGYWSVPFLKEVVYGPKSVKGVRIPMNAIMVLARILDLRALPELRGAAQKHEDVEVRKTAGLALGLFRRAEDLPLLTRLLQDGDFRHGHQRSAAIALAKLRTPGAQEVLRAAVATPARDVHVAAATLLAAVIAAPGIDLSPYLNHDEKLLRSVAAAALMLRPLAAAEAGPLLALLKKPREDREVRALQFHALGAIRDRTDEIRDRLLACVVKGDERGEARIAALVGLAYEYGRGEVYAPLRRYYGSLSGRNDPQVGPLLFAMARSGDPKAVEDLVAHCGSGSDFIAFYAGASLLHLVAFAPQELPSEAAVFDAIAKLRDRPDALLRELSDLGFQVRAEKDRQRRPALAAGGFTKLRDPKDLHLWDWDASQRAWGTANGLLHVIFELDDVAEKGKATSPGGPPPGGKEGRTGATPEEQDLLDFLGEAPYFVPEDLGGG